MFRIESYITPIILSHIDKYVKDFRSKDAQVSLWGGEVAFQNLDLRLDVLEEELQLPFSFVSGHIHELTVLVPWTKIASEPIQITINTIEFVLKLKTNDEQRPTGSAPSRKKSSAEMAAQAAVAPGYMASLINKIANNVSVKLHNIILKYVEEDIVVSMNIQLLSFDSADDNWEPAFIDINPVKVLLKKVIKISDLTICLDKRNSLGIIEVCQEPMLYRCSMQIRMLRRYNISSVHANSILRMDIFTDSIGLNITSQQYPMVMRLLVLANTLRDGSLKRVSQLSAAEIASQSGGEDDPNLDDSSMLSWAWNMLPTLFPADATEDEVVARKLGHILHTGIYVKQIQITFKSQELVNDHISSGSKKLKYHPMLKVSLVGLYSNTITVGNRWFNASGGCSFFGVYPLGMCVCGKAHNCKAFITSADILCDHQAFLDDSLWDQRCPENGGEFRSYDRLWESHEVKVSMDELLRRTPAMAFDMTHGVDLSDDHGSISNLSSNFEYSNLNETHLARASVGEFHLRHNSSLVHIIETLVEFSKRYNYAPYAPEPQQPIRSQLGQPSEENIEGLMNEIPLRNFQLTVHRPVIEIHPGLHDSRSRLPFFLLELEDIQMRMTDAYYPNRLIITTCMIPEPPAKLLDACHVKYSVDFARMSVSTCYGSEKQNCHIKINNCEFTLKKLQSPDLFVQCSEPKMVTGVNVENVSLYMSNPQLMLTHCMVDSIVAHKSVHARMFETSLITDSKDQTLPIVDLSINRIIANVTLLHQLYGVEGSISNINGLVYIPSSIAQVGYIESHKQKAIFLAAENSHQDFLAMFLQMPANIQEKLPKNNPPILALSVGHLQANIDPLLIQFLNYKLHQFSRSTSLQPIELNNESKSNSISISTRSPPRSQKNSDLVSSSDKKTPRPSTTSVHSIPDIDVPKHSLVQIFPINSEAPVAAPSDPIDFVHIHDLAKKTMVQVDIKQWTIYVPDRSLRMGHRDSKLKEIIPAILNLNVSVFEMPFWNIRSSHEMSALHDPHQVRPFPVQMGKSIWTAKKDGFPWTVTMSSLSGATVIGGEEVQFLASTTTTVTVMITMRTAHSGPKKKTMEPAFVIHVDTTPVVLSFSENQICFLHRSIEALRVLLTLSYKLPDVDRKSIIRPKSPYCNITELKEFLGSTVALSETTTSEGTATTVKEYELDPLAPHVASDVQRSVWLQWTLTKITVHLFAIDSSTSVQHRFTLDLEDCISSYDQQEVYTKLKTKLGTMSGVCHSRNSGSASEEWIKNDVLGLIARNTLNDSQEETFFELTVTKALTKNVHGKWFTRRLKKKKNTQLINTITEVMATIQSVDVKLGVDTLNHFVPVINAFTCASPLDDHAISSEPTAPKITCVSDLPLVFFTSHGIRVFLPLPKNASPECNVLCMKITKIAVSPTAENPLQRKPVRSDIYSKAAELRILHTPGSRVEDRQYEILCSNISMSSGRWEQIRELLDPSEGTVKDAHRKNPAFDWNNLTMKPTAEEKPIFERFNMSVVFAPCIMLDSVLVCGQCIEINCLTDLMVEMKSLDVRLLLQLASIAQSTNGRSTPIPKSSTTNLSCRSTTPKITTISGQAKAVTPSRNYPLTDSGIESFEIPKRHSVLSYPGVMSLSESMSLLEDDDSTKVKTTIPYDVSFVGGIFNLKMYHNIIPPNESTDDTELIRRLPLISLSLFQPNVLISQSHIEKNSQFSLFNAVVKLGSPSPSKDDLNEFGDVIFTTQPGTANQFGIHPPLVCVKEHILHSGEKNIDVSARRPIVVRFNHETLDKCLKIFQTIDFRINNKTRAVADPIPIEKISYKIKSLQKSFFGADRLDVYIGSTDIRCVCPKERYSARLSMDWFQSRVVFSERPQRLRFDGRLKSLMLWAGDGVALHPLSVKFFGKLTKEPWKKVPLTLISIKSDCVDVSLGPNNLRNLSRVQNAFAKSGEKFGADLRDTGLLEKVTLIEGKQNISTLLPIQTPRVEHDSPQGRSQDEDGELYQDDLRAGAFQFIDATYSESLPLPYQIQIMSRDGGVICWCYPQPRSLQYVQIFPVPFHIQDSGRQQPKSIKCELQYFSNVRREFQPYCQFNLSEKSIQELKLPAHRITAKVWRILVHQSYVSINGQQFLVDVDDEDYQDDDETMPEEEYPLNTNRSASQEPDLMNLHPKALVGCMRIDSKFSAVAVSSVELTVDVNHFSIGLRHDREPSALPTASVPTIIRQYSLNAANTHREWQTFLKLDQRNFGGHVRLWDGNKVSIQAETGMSASVLDFGYLTTVPLLEECQMKLAVDISGSTTELNIVTDTIRLRYGHMVGQTLAIAHQLWTEHESASLVLASRYILCNCTSVPIKIGQIQTDEAIFLQSNEATFYSFRSTRGEQKLRISLETIDWTSTTSIRINNNENMQIIPMREPSTLITVTTHKMAGSHLVVMIKGQIEFRNMSEVPFHIQYRVNNSQNTMNTDPIGAADLVVDGKANMSVVTRCDEGISQTIKLRLLNQNRKNWSGEVPLHRTNRNTPWLVKVPTETDQQYTSFWVRVIREDLPGFEAPPPSQRPQRLLIIIWPFVMLRSMLPITIETFDNSKKTKTPLKGFGSEEIELALPGTHETEHEVEFDTNSYFSTRTKLSYKAIDRNVFFKEFDKQLTIDAINETLQKPLTVNWPSSLREEEIRCSHNYSQVDPLTLQFKHLPSRELSNCLMLEVNPCCLFVNSTNCTVLLKNSDETSTVIHSNHIATPSSLTDTFTLSVMLTNKLYPTCPIYIKPPRLRATPSYELGVNNIGSTVVKVLSPSGLSKLHLTSSLDNDLRVIFLSSHFVFINSSSIALNIWAFCALQRQRQTIRLPDDSSESIGTYTVGTPIKGESPRGVALSTFFNLSHDPADTNFNKLYNYFVTLRIDHNEFCVPIQLNRTIQRKCFSVSGPNGPHPLSLSVLDHCGQTFVSVYDDKFPAIILENRTDRKMYVAQAESPQVSLPQKTLNDEHFDWYTTVCPGATIFYTPPSVDGSFPEKMDQQVAILLACFSDNSSGPIDWSRPILYNEPSETYLEQPYIKVSVDKSQRSVHIMIEPINQDKEFNVKDIRTKLQRPTRQSTNIHPDRPAQLESNSDTAPNSSPRPNPKQSSELALNAFVKGFQFILYSDDENQHSIKSEVLALYMDYVHLQYDQRTRSAQLNVTNVQVDNQLHSAGNFDFPVLLCPQNIFKVHKQTTLPHPNAIEPFIANLFAEHPKPVCAVRLIFYENSFDPEEIRCTFQPISAYIEDKYINVLLDVMLENLPTNLVYAGDTVASQREHVEAGQVLVPRQVTLQALDLAQPFQVRLVRIDPVSVLLSVHTCMRMYIALDHSPLDFDAFERENIYSLPSRFGYHLGMHYVSGALFGAGWVVGSLEILGSPSGLARSVTTGLRDFVSMPVEGFWRGPWGLLVGITHGSASLIRNVTAGTVNSVTKMAASFARNLDRLSLDDEHLQRTEALRRQRPTGISDGISQGLTGLGISILGAVGGLARHPLEAQSSMAVFTGFGRGLVGAVTKPISGAAELVALAGQGVLQTVGFNAMPAAREPSAPRVGSLEPSPAKISRKLIPEAYANDQVLFVGLATVLSAGCVCIALTQRLLIMVETKTDRVRQIYSLERIALRPNGPDVSKVTICVDGAGSDQMTDEQEFQYDRVMAFVRESCEMLPRNVVKSVTTTTEADNTSPVELAPTEDAPRNDPAVDNSRPSSKAEAEKPTTVNVTFYMDPHLAKYLVDYVELLQKNLARRK